jgi:2-C-methyl-D-erythritol 4-phosphate cytidylyltransferase
VDQIVIVCDPSYQAYTPLTKQIEVAYVSQGKTRNGSVKNGLDFIAANYDCQRVCILDAVRPFVSSQIIEEYLSRLADYEAVVTCQKITGELGNYHHDVLDRNDYYLTESPEAFRFDTLYQNFSLDKPSTEVVNHLPTTCSRYLNFDFSFNPKITYYFDLEYAANMLKKNSASK